VRGQLLVVHGTLDENVHPRHTVWLEEALRIAGRDATVVMIPNERHLHRPAARRRWLTLAVDYLRRASEQPAVRSTGPRGQAAS
jgi:dipeptidyl-peptidase-4